MALNAGNDFKNFCSQLSRNKLSESYIIEHRRKIKDEILKYIGREITVSNFEKIITLKSLQLMLSLYDKYFFENKLLQFVKEHGCTFNICYNNRCTRTGGFCKLRVGKCVTIEIASKVMKKAFEHDGEKTSGNIKCDDILECLQLTFEHELIHGIMFCFCLNIERKTSKDIPGLWTGKTIKGHNKTFMSILNNLFGHTDYYHGLLKKSKSNCDIKLVKKLAKIGSTVKFEFEKNDEKISKIGVVTKKTSTKLHINVGKQEFKRWGEPPIVTDAIWKVSFSLITEVDGMSTLKEIPPVPEPETINNNITPSKKSNSVILLENNTPIKKKFTIKKKKPKSPTKTVTKPNTPPKTVTKPNTPTKTVTKPNTLTKKVTKPKTPPKSITKSKKIIYAGRVDKNKKVHNTNQILEGQCIFPFKFKRKDHYECLDTGNGPWCATKLKPSGTMDKWGYCI
jgi:hypothetical protein